MIEENVMAYILGLRLEVEQLKAGRHFHLSGTAEYQVRVRPGERVVLRNDTAQDLDLRIRIEDPDSLKRALIRKLGET